MFTQLYHEILEILRRGTSKVLASQRDLLRDFAYVASSLEILPEQLAGQIQLHTQCQTVAPREGMFSRSAMGIWVNIEYASGDYRRVQATVKLTWDNPYNALLLEALRQYILVSPSLDAEQLTVTHAGLTVNIDGVRGMVQDHYDGVRAVLDAEPTTT